MPTPNFRALSALECDVLHNVWLIEEKLGRQKATRDRLARAVDVAPSYLAKIVSRIRNISEEHYIRSYRLHGRSDGKRRAGPPRVYYELLGDRLVTFPETAFILLRLLESPRELARRINRAEFISSIASLSGLDEISISQRIEWTIENSYVVADGSTGHVGCQDRTVLEKPYLEMIASHFEVRTASKTA